LPRIAITGAPGTGKTTLARALAEKLDAPLFEEDFHSIGAAANAAWMAFHRGEELAPYLDQYGLECLNWLERRAASFSASSFVADRFGIDVLVVSLDFRICGSDAWAYRLIRETQKHASNIDLIVVPPLVNLGQGKPNEDGIRRNESYRALLATHSMTKGMLMELLPRRRSLFLSRSAGTTEERVAEVCRYL
jgi:hypothetical protein